MKFLCQVMAIKPISFHDNLKRVKQSGPQGFLQIIYSDAGNCRGDFLTFLFQLSLARYTNFDKV